jgi:arginase family enzyme
MIKGVRILDFDESVVGQRTFCAQFKPTIVHLNSLQKKVRFWANDKMARQIKSALIPSQKNCLTFIGSSDYHHVTGILLKQFIHPITVIVFDHRPDWSIVWPKLACNSWVSRAVEEVNMINVIEFGVGKKDMQRPWKMAGNLRSYRGGRLKIYGKHPMSLLPKIVDQIHTEDVYISLDKSCLRADENLSNWDAGDLSLKMVLDIIHVISRSKRIVGMDVTGEYSKPYFEHIFKRMFAGLLRQEKISTAFHHSQDEIDRINEAANIRIASAIFA